MSVYTVQRVIKKIFQFSEPALIEGIKMYVASGFGLAPRAISDDVSLASADSCQR